MVHAWKEQQHKENCEEVKKTRKVQMALTWVTPILKKYEHPSLKKFQQQTKKSSLSTEWLPTIKDVYQKWIKEHEANLKQH